MKVIVKELSIDNQVYITEFDYQQAISLKENLDIYYHKEVMTINPSDFDIFTGHFYWYNWKPNNECYE